MQTASASYNPKMGTCDAVQTSSHPILTLRHDIHHANNFYLPVLVAGLPLNQNVVQYGPFVLNTQEQVYQAMLDYQSHSNGFERAAGWKSEIGKSMIH